MEKRGISSIIAVVLIILIVIVAIAILWAGIIPLINQELVTPEMTGFVEIWTFEGYTVYDPDTEELFIQIKQTAGENIGKVRIYIYSGGNFLTSDVVESPGPNLKKVYNFEWNTSLYPEPEFGSVAPIFIKGNREVLGDATKKVKIPRKSGSGGGGPPSQPLISINDKSVVEPDSGTIIMSFDVSLSFASSEIVTVDYETNDGTAQASDNDYVGISPAQQLIFPVGITQKNIDVVINGDQYTEADENFSVVLSNPANATIGGGTGIGTITNEDDITEGLVSQWLFEDGSGTKTVDLVGSNNGTLINMDPEDWVLGGRKPGNYSLNFDGVNEYVNISDDPSLDITNRITISAWVKINDSVNQKPVFGKWDYPGKNASYSLWWWDPDDASPYVLLPNLALSFDGDYDSTPYDVYGTTVPQLGVWYHVVSTYNGTTMKIYVNGTFENSAAGPSSIHISDEPVQIGGFPTDMSYFNGSIDDVRLYNRDLSAYEASSLYALES